VFIEMLVKDPPRFLAWVTVVAFSVCVHETAHAWCAWSQGDDTAVRNGYGDMDPRKLMGWPSLLALALFGIAWGAVPVTPSRLRRRWGEALVAFSGPASNLLLAGVFGLAHVLIGRFVPEARPVLLILVCGLQANCLLGVLNLVPVPPFDGWPVARYLVPSLREVPADRLNLVSWIAIIVLLATPLRNVLYTVADGIAIAIVAAASAVAAAVG
jgi:Zn-dependent protease